MTHEPCCPVIGSPIPTDAEAFLSTHRTATGRVAYIRCDCDGTAVLAAGRQHDWQVVGHASASRPTTSVPASASCSL